MIDNWIGYDGAKQISEMLKVNTSLTSLNLLSVKNIRIKKQTK